MKFQQLKIIKCKPYDNYKLWLLFSDGVSGEVKKLVGKGIFSAWNSIEFFNSVRIDKKSDTVAWAEDLDLDPYVLHEQIVASTQ